MKTVTVVIAAIVITAIIVVPAVYYLAKPAGPSAPPKLKIGFITTSDETDLGWSASAVEAAEYAEIKYDAETDVTRFAVIAVGDTPRMIRDYVAAGYDIVVTNGAEFSVYVIEPALEAPDVKFIAINPPFEEEELPPNVLGVYEASREAVYLAGVLAGHMTETKSVGHITGENYLPLHLEALAFEDGVKSVDPTVDVHLVYAGTWIDATLGYTLATSMIEEYDVDIILQCADVTGRGVVSAVEEAGIWVIGCYGDQSSWAPNNTLTSYEMDYSPIIDFVMEAIAEDKWDQYAGKIWELGLSVGTGYLVPFTFFIDDLVPDEAKADIESAKQDIIEGRITLRDDEYRRHPKLPSP